MKKKKKIHLIPELKLEDTLANSHNIAPIFIYISIQTSWNRTRNEHRQNECQSDFKSTSCAQFDRPHAGQQKSPDKKRFSTQLRREDSTVDAVSHQQDSSSVRDGKGLLFITVRHDETELTKERRLTDESAHTRRTLFGQD